MAYECQNSDKVSLEKYNLRVIFCFPFIKSVNGFKCRQIYFTIEALKASNLLQLFVFSWKWGHININNQNCWIIT